MSRLPSVIVVGAPKCGTTALHAFFSAHPAAFIHRSSELHWWASSELSANAEGPGDRRALRAVCSSRSEYEAAFSGAPVAAAALVETSPSYLFWPAVADRLATNLPDAKVVVLVRDPVKRAWSQYWHQVRAGVEPLDFESALEAETLRAARRWGDLWRYLGHSFYADGIRRYQKALGPANVLVLDAETLGSATTAQRLASFVGLPPSDGVVRQVHRGGRPRSGPLTSVVTTVAPLARAVLPTPARHRLRDLSTRLLTTPVPPVPPSLHERLDPIFEADQARVRALRHQELQHDDG